MHFKSLSENLASISVILLLLFLSSSEEFVFKFDKKI
jgi:hypothetical protein